VLKPALTGILGIFEKEINSNPGNASRNPQQNEDNLAMNLTVRTAPIAGTILRHAMTQKPLSLMTPGTKIVYYWLMRNRPFDQ
jgi:hypothetical protein